MSKKSERGNLSEVNRGPLSPNEETVFTELRLRALLNGQFLSFPFVTVPGVQPQRSPLDDLYMEAEQKAVNLARRAYPDETINRNEIEAEGAQNAQLQFAREMAVNDLEFLGRTYTYAITSYVTQWRNIQLLEIDKENFTAKIVKRKELDNGEIKEGRIIPDPTNPKISYPSEFRYEINKGKVEVKEWHMALGQQFDMSTAVVSVLFDKGNISGVRFMFPERYYENKDIHYPKSYNIVQMLGTQLLHDYLQYENKFFYDYVRGWGCHWNGIELSIPAREDKFPAIWYVNSNVRNVQRASYEQWASNGKVRRTELQRNRIHRFNNENNIFEDDLPSYLYEEPFDEAARTKYKKEEMHTIPLQDYLQMIGEIFRLIPLEPKL